jgi:glycosyltransferase involved in cell wall biosynthesis
MVTNNEALLFRNEAPPGATRTFDPMRSGVGRFLRIGIVAPPWIPIPPPSYGGIEHVVALLGKGLADRGHRVKIVAAPGSRVEGAEVVHALDGLPAVIGNAIDEWHHLSRALDELADCDVVIDHSGPLGALLTAAGGPPALHVVHGPMDELAGIYRTIAGRCADLRLLAISHAQTRLAPDLPFAGVCRNALDVDIVPFREKPDAEPYLAFLGRICPDKGVASAIRVARAAGLPLKIAAKCREAEEIAHFAEVVEPELGDDVAFLGEIGPEEKFELLGGARALIFPIQWEEPFGLVMIEAMACGTPVLATPRGAAPEVVADGVTGYIHAEEAALAAAAARLDDIDRAECRAWVERHFSGPAMASAYEDVARRVARPFQAPRTAALSGSITR